MENRILPITFQTKQNFMRPLLRMHTPYAVIMNMWTAFVSSVEHKTTYPIGIYGYASPLADV